MFLQNHKMQWNELNYNKYFSSFFSTQILIIIPFINVIMQEPHSHYFRSYRQVRDNITIWKAGTIVVMELFGIKQ